MWLGYNVECSHNFTQESHNGITMLHFCKKLIKTNLDTSKLSWSFHHDIDYKHSFLFVRINMTSKLPPTRTESNPDGSFEWSHNSQCDQTAAAVTATRCPPIRSRIPGMGTWYNCYAEVNQHIFIYEREPAGLDSYFRRILTALTQSMPVVTIFTFVLVVRGTFEATVEPVCLGCSGIGSSSLKNALASIYSPPPRTAAPTTLDRTLAWLFSSGIARWWWF